MNIYKLRNRFGYRATSIIRFACHNISPSKKTKFSQKIFAGLGCTDLQNHSLASPDPGVGVPKPNIA